MKENSPHWKIAGIILGLGAYASLANTSQAAVITWTEQGTIVNENVIQPNVTSAFNLAGGTGTNAVTTTTQTVTFVNSDNSSITVSNGLTLTMVTGFNTGITANVWDGTPIDADFNAVMDSFAHSGTGNPATGTFTLSGLTDGTTYSVQIFTSDFRNNIGNVRGIQFNDGLGNSTATGVLQSDKQYFIGTFTAVGTSQTIGAVSTNQGTNGSVILNALTVSIIPEPSSALLGAIGALVLLRRRR